VSELEFNVPFQHKHGYIRDDPGVVLLWFQSILSVSFGRFFETKLRSQFWFKFFWWMGRSAVHRKAGYGQL